MAYLCRSGRASVLPGSSLRAERRIQPHPCGITSRPELTRDAPPGSFFTQARYRNLVDSAAARFITVVPEIDMPGHSTAAIAVCPELTSQETSALAQSSEEMLAKLIAGEIRPLRLEPGRAEVWRFVDDVIAEVAALTPVRFIHVGGDGAFGMPAKDHGDFVARARELVRAHGKEPMGWQETARVPAEPAKSPSSGSTKSWHRTRSIPS
ncbi:family 20 glycosylhydrolase [Streptomyces sp. NBC_01221]|uniref:family 20 glycosylhydrolase n=1 Tax=unclassified Streptomyces TaxID=2593676 RepID=UPI0022588508|nr:family 20 glycosylhydrolase [Streptomyces sp. NBC_01221]MCX4791002.1 family 20 glycosylhydrolase [Streptomyces sp. NBC_01221]WSP59251.1 family 20 glycosylhydrolase [Streptomyces sp. NBC_01241]